MGHLVKIINFLGQIWVCYLCPHRGGHCPGDSKILATGLVFSGEDKTNIPKGEQLWKGTDNEEVLSNVKIDHKMVEDRLNKLRIDKSTGADGLSLRLRNLRY